MQAAHQHLEIFQPVVGQFMCGEVNVYHIEKGLFVLLFCFRWLMEPFNEALEIFAGDGGFVGCGVDLPLQQVGQGF